MLNNVDLIIAAAAVIIGNGGIAWAGMKRAMNGIDKDLSYLKTGQDELRTNVKDIQTCLHEVDTRVAILESNPKLKN